VLDALGGKGAPPKADSLATLLSQALVAEDRALVERCLNVSDAQTVNNTVARLQPHVAVRLLNAALDRMRTKPTRGEQLARWMRTVMLHHAGYITTSAKAQRAVMELQQTVEAHVAMQRPLLGLLGRLDLLLHKRQQVPDGEDGVDGTGDGGEGPLTVYAEGEDDVNVLNEVVGNEESEDDEWETDDEKDEDDLEGFDDKDDDEDDDEDDEDEDGEDMEDDFDGEDDEDE
jgi:U3 small nucleolar RNA-associated protein 5